MQHLLQLALALGQFLRARWRGLGGTTVHGGWAGGGELRQDVRRGRRRGAACGADGFRRRGEDQLPHLLRGIGQRRQLRPGGAGLRFDHADADGQRTAGEGRAERHEAAARQVAELLRLPPLHAQKVGGALHVDVEEGAAHQEVRGLGGDVLGQLGEALRGDDAGQPALAAARHQVGHGAERGAAGLVGNLGRGGGGEDLGLVHHDQHGGPEVALHLEHAVQEDGRLAHLPLGIQPLQVQHHGDAVLAHPLGGGLEAALGLRGGVDHQMAELLGEADEIAFRVDHRLLHPGGGLFHQPPQQMRLAGAGIALDQQACGEKLLQVESRGRAGGGGAEVDRDGHAGLGSSIRVGGGPPAGRGGRAAGEGRL